VRIDERNLAYLAHARAAAADTHLPTRTSRTSEAGAQRQHAAAW
jgi:hypothetical protein